MDWIDGEGHRLNVGIVLINSIKEVFIASRIRTGGWQMPQGGISLGEVYEEAMYRELFEEIGISKENVEIIGATKHWLYYDLPEKYIKYNQIPLVIGQKQKWFLLKLLDDNCNIDLNSSKSPEFDNYCWVDYWKVKDMVINFKKKVYNDALKELSSFIF